MSTKIADYYGFIVIEDALSASKFILHHDVQTKAFSIYAINCQCKNATLFHAWLSMLSAQRSILSSYQKKSIAIRSSARSPERRAGSQLESDLTSGMN